MSKALHLVSQEAGPQAEWVDLTPALAEQWLGRNKHNRNLRWVHVNGLARDMEAGLWRVNSEAIAFDTNEDMIDGQHRTHAVIQSGATIRVLVVRGLAPEAQETIDLGRLRTAGDALRLRGKSDTTTVAAVARKVLAWQANYRTFGGGFSPTQQEILAAVESDDLIEEAAKAATHYRSGVPCPAGISGLAWWLFAKIDEEAAESFFEQLSTGEDLRAGSPILALRNRLADIRMSRNTPPAEDLLRGFIRAWNAYRDGRTLDKIPFAPGASGEKFPEPK